VAATVAGEAGAVGAPRLGIGIKSVQVLTSCTASFP
jgi:hypothetical protein